MSPLAIHLHNTIMRLELLGAWHTAAILRRLLDDEVAMYKALANESPDALKEKDQGSNE